MITQNLTAGISLIPTLVPKGTNKIIPGKDKKTTETNWKDLESTENSNKTKTTSNTENR
jgi:hypothetical protein